MPKILKIEKSDEGYVAVVVEGFENTQPSIYVGDLKETDKAEFLNRLKNKLNEIANITKPKPPVVKPTPFKSLEGGEV